LQSRSRSDITKDHLLRAAEKLFARDGLANVSVRAIVIEAGQKNESALQYHFGNRNGLIAALHEQRNAQIRKERGVIIEEMLGANGELTLRQVAIVMVRPAFQLAARDAGFRDYTKTFAQVLLLSGRKLTSVLLRNEDKATQETRKWLRAVLAHLDDDLIDLRFENAARFAALSMSGHANEKGAFNGRAAEFFFNNLVDTIAAMMAADPSPETLALLPVKN